MPEPASNDPKGEPTFIAPHGDSGIQQSLQETLIAGPQVSSADGATQLGTSDEMESFSDYESPVPSSQATKLIQIGDRQVKKVLGRGGMGVVYLAWHRKLKRYEAIKMMLAGAHATPDQAQRFLTEAQAVAHLQHDNIEQIYEVGEHDGLPFFTLELVDGQSLDQQLRNKTLSEHDAAALMQTLCTALQYAHDQGILHRDLKPANVLMTADGRPKVTDFGLVRKVEADESSKIKVGTIMGTPSDMSPQTDPRRRASEAEPLLKETYEASLAQLTVDPHNPRLRHDVVGQAGLWAEFRGFTGKHPLHSAAKEELQCDSLI